MLTEVVVRAIREFDLDLSEVLKFTTDSMAANFPGA
jgi:hypothetical protein